MGYIFDAMNRSDEQRPGDGVSNPNYAPPAESPAPAPIANEDASAPTPAVTIDPDRLQLPVQPWTPRNTDDRLHALVNPSSVMAEEYRAIRTGILARNDQRRHLVHTITSATPQEGKTITSLNLGMTFAELTNRKVLVIEADLRLPQFAKLMPLPETPGLVGLLEGQAGPADSICRMEGCNAHFLPAGKRAGNNAVQLLSSPAMASLLEKMRRKYDHVIIDTPPVVELADAGILGGLSDDVLLIARMNCTPAPLIEQAVRTLARYNAPVAGVITTDQQRQKQGYYYKYGYRYGYRNSERYYQKAA